jgi:hypothetical protein
MKELTEGNIDNFKYATISRAEILLSKHTYCNAKLFLKLQLLYSILT